MIRNCLVCEREFKTRDKTKTPKSTVLGRNRVNCGNKKCTRTYTRIYRHMTLLRRAEE